MVTIVNTHTHTHIYMYMNMFMNHLHGSESGQIHCHLALSRQMTQYFVVKYLNMLNISFSSDSEANVFFIIAHYQYIICIRGCFKMSVKSYYEQIKFCSKLQYSTALQFVTRVVRVTLHLVIVSTHSSTVIPVNIYFRLFEILKHQLQYFKAIRYV